MYQPMRRQNDQPGSIHINKGHHDQFVGREAHTVGPDQAILRRTLTGNSAPESRRRHSTPLIAISQCGLVTMMTIRNDELFVTHLVPHKLDYSGFADLP